MTTDKPDFLQEAGPAAWRMASQVVTAVGQVLLWILTAIGRVLRPVTNRLVAALYGKSPPAQAAARHPARGRTGRTRDRTPAYATPAASTPPPTARSTPAAGGRPPGPGAPDAAAAALGARLAEFGELWTYGPVTGAMLALAALLELPLHHLQVVSLPGGFALGTTLPLMFRRESLRPAAAIALGSLAASLLSGQPLLATTAFAGMYTLFLLAQQLPRQSTGVLGVGGVVTVGVVYLASEQPGRHPLAGRPRGGRRLPRAGRRPPYGGDRRGQHGRGARTHQRDPDPTQRRPA